LDFGDGRGLERRLGHQVSLVIHGCKLLAANESPWVKSEGQQQRNIQRKRRESERKVGAEQQGRCGKMIGLCSEKGLEK